MPGGEFGEDSSGNCNEADEDLCRVIIMNTWFSKKVVHLAMWKHSA